MNIEILKNLIRDGYNLEFTYDGYKRVFCPHLIGWKKGKLKLFGVQFGGSSSSPLKPNGNWKCLFVDKINNLKKIEKGFKTLSYRRGKSTCIDKIIAKHPNLN